MKTIRELRKKKNLSQQQLAKVINVHQTAISQWETGKTSPDKATLELLACYFDVTTDYILGRTAIPLSQPLELNEINLLLSFRTLNAEGKRELNKYGKILIASKLYTTNEQKK